MNFYVYILECADKSYYVGHARGLPQRFSRHADGTGARHTATHPPRRIVFSELFETEIDAVRREMQIKKWSRAKKKALIEGNVVGLHKLSRSHDHKKPPAE